LGSIRYCGNRKKLGIEERGGGKKIAQNGQDPRLFGDVVGQPQAICPTEGI
jgi:hypothetical protein